MTKGIRFNDPGDGAWIMSRCLGVYNDKIDQCIAVHDDGVVQGGVVYNLFLETAYMLHMAGREYNWASRDFLWMVYDYPFNVVGVTTLLGLVDARNERAMKIDKRMGFYEAMRLPGLLPGGGDLVVMRMEREHCWALNHLSPPKGWHKPHGGHPDGVQEFVTIH